MKLANLAWLTLFIAAPAVAQNSDVGILFSATRARFDFGTRSETQYRIGIQANYARQLAELTRGRIYLEIPVSGYSGPVRQGTIVDFGNVRIFSRPDGIVFFTPGVRYHLNLNTRMVVYAAAGAGIALRRQKNTTVLNAPDGSIPNPLISVRAGWRTSGAFNLGGGLDFRLTRLLSLRGEFRSFRTSSQPGFGDGRQYPSVHAGLAFHF